MSEHMFDYVAADGSEWEVSLIPPGAMPWATLSATPIAGGLPLNLNIDPAVLGVFGPYGIAEVIASINERCQPCP
jgi:hypothetical protein